ncbi:MAG TPA: hypothetical protein VFS10_00585, partial [Pyrinomonadaceae bacterium]|nr:hypothetical protein [Pyrinomonadaceae bacterium]
LDTGFIARFNERQAQAAEAATETDEEETARRDVAIIAAALAYERELKNSSPLQQAEQPSSRWKLAGRVALHQSRTS